MTTGSGRCLCGHIRFKFDPDAVIWTGFCHCESCRRATASPVTAFFGVRDSAWRWSGGAPARHDSSPGVRRSFCPRCGTQLAFESQRHPGEIHGYTATLDDPETLPPDRHFHAEEALSWVRMADDLPRLHGPSGQIEPSAARG